MAKIIEPLLKEEVETFPFLEENKNVVNKDKSKRIQIIVTAILAVIILYFVIQVFIAFYMGFKYYDLRYEDTTQETAK